MRADAEFTESALAKTTPAIGWSNAFARSIGSSPFSTRSDYADPIAAITFVEASVPVLVGIIWKSA